MPRIPSPFRGAAAVAAAVVLSAASRDSAPNYYSHSEFYSNASYTTQVGGWLSCPPSAGGYTYWGQTTSYSIHTENDYAACSLAK